LFPPPRFLPGRVRHRLVNSTLNGRYPEEGTRQDPFKIDHPLGACMLIRPEAVRQAGGFSEELRMYSEEIDLALRFEGAGWECWQVPSSRVIHIGGQSTRQMPDKMYLELWRSRIFVSSRYYSALDTLALRAILVGAEVLRSISTLIARRRGRVSRAEARRRWRLAGALIRLALRP
jgi:GT2 family glycosyltransferase